MDKDDANDSTSVAHKPRKIRWQRFVLYLFVTWLGLAGSVELILRLAGYSPPSSVLVSAKTDPFRPDSELTWALKKNWSGAEPNGAPVATNSLGLRGPEIDQTPEYSKKRILFLGDSVTYGHFLPDTGTIPARLQFHLKNNQSQLTEVINAGVPGYSTFQSEIYFRSAGQTLKPSIVLLGFCFNDVTERYSNLAAFGGTKFFMDNVDTTVGMSWPRRFWHGTATRHAMVSMIRDGARRGEDYRVSKLWTAPKADHIVAAWEHVFGEIDELARETDESGAKFAVVIYPYAFQIFDSHFGAGPQRRLIQHLDKRGIAFLDLLEPLKRSQLTPEAMYLDHNHFATDGSELVATKIANWMDASSFLE